MSRTLSESVSGTVASARQYTAGVIFIVSIIWTLVMVVQSQVVAGLITGGIIFAIGYVIAPDPDTVPDSKDTGGSWRSLPPTQKQIDYALDMGIENPHRYTRGGLSDELSEFCGTYYDDDDEDEEDE